MPFFIVPPSKTRAYSNWPTLSQFGSFIRNQIIHRRLNPAAGVRHPGQLECHLYSRYGAEDHRLVQVAKMADAEDPAAQSVESAAERDIEFVEAYLTHFVRIIAFRQPDSGDRIGLGAGIDGVDFRSVVLPPDAHRAPRC